MSSSETARYSSTKIDNIRRLAPEVLCVTLDVPAGYAWKPGQHLGATNSPSGKLSYYSIASAQEGTAPAKIELAMHEPSIKWPVPLQSGDELFLSKPAGGPDLERLSQARHVVLIGMGTGVSPLRSIVQAFLALPEERAPKVTLLHGARDHENCIFFDELSSMQDERFTYAPVLSRLAASSDWTGRTGRVQSHLKEFPVEGSYFCVCGKLPMVSEVAHLLKERGAQDEQIFSEGY